MAKFSFRLQKVLEFRRLEEEDAKQAFVAAQAAKQEREYQIQKLVDKRFAVIRVPATTVEQRLHVERILDMLDGEERSHKTVLAVLETEEAQAQSEWNTRRQAVKIIEKLMERAHDEWKLGEERREQNELDEWAVTRRAG